MSLDVSIIWHFPPSCKHKFIISGYKIVILCMILPKTGYTRCRNTHTEKAQDRRINRIIFLIENHNKITELLFSFIRRKFGKMQNTNLFLSEISISKSQWTKASLFYCEYGITGCYSILKHMVYLYILYICLVKKKRTANLNCTLCILV